MNSVTILKEKNFTNGSVYALKTSKESLVETTDTFLPYETIDAVGRKTNKILNIKNLGSRRDRWMIGASVMSGCPVKCKFCATAHIKSVKLLDKEEIIEQVDFILRKNPRIKPQQAKEFRILFTRMGEPALNIAPAIKAIEILKKRFPCVQIVISTIGIRNEFLEKLYRLREKFNEDFIQLQFSIHSTSKRDRDWLQPYKNKMKFSEINKFAKGWVKDGYRKATLNFTITAVQNQKDIRQNEFDVTKLKRYFDKRSIFIKLSPLNDNRNSMDNHLIGIIKERNLI